MSAVTTAVRNWIRSPVTWTATVLVAVAAGVALWLNPPRDDTAGPPAEIGTAKVGGYCTTVVVSYDQAVWALAPGSRSGELRRVDAADVGRDSPECQRPTVVDPGNRTGR